MKNLDAIQAVLDQVSLTKVEAIKLAAERQQQISQLTKAGHEQAKQAEEFQKQLEKMQQSLQEKNKRIADLETKIAERTYREQLLENEMIKAEAQLDLIKDVLMREPGI